MGMDGATANTRKGIACAMWRCGSWHPHVLLEGCFAAAKQGHGQLLQREAQSPPYTASRT